jgi:hypothetical protein
MTPNTFKAIVRSITPWAIASVVWLVQHFGFHASTIQADRVLGVLGVLITIGAHALETKWKWFGVLLGWIGAPSYVKTITKKQEIAQLQAQINGMVSSGWSVRAVPVTTPVTPAPGTPVATATPVVEATPVVAATPVA